MTTSKDSVDSYLGTIDRIEPDISLVDTGAALASIAISLKRIADAVEGMREPEIKVIPKPRKRSTQ